MAYWQRQLRRWQGSLESAHYITWSTKCCLYFLKLWKILCTFGQKLEGKRGQRKTEWDHGWVKFSCSLISIYLLLKKTIILLRKRILMFYGRTVCLMLGCHVFLASKLMVATLSPSHWASHWLCQEGSILFPKWSHACAQELVLQPPSPNLQPQTQRLCFPPLLAGREQEWNIKSNLIASSGKRAPSLLCPSAEVVRLQYLPGSRRSLS